MEFQGAKYHIYNRYRDHIVFSCKTYRQSLQETTPGYELFKIEVGSRISNENSRDESIDRLTAKAWRQLTANGRAHYNRRARESKVAKPVNPRCMGRLKFRKVNGRTLLSEDGLISYRPHSEQCKYSETNVRLEQIVQAGGRRPSGGSSDLKIENDEPMHRQNDSHESGVEPMDHLNGSHDSDGFNQEDTLFSSSGAPLKLVFEEEYKEICEGESFIVQYPPSPAPLSPPPSEPEVEYIVIDD